MRNIKFGAPVALLIAIASFFAHPENCVSSGQIVDWLSLNVEQVASIASLIAVIVAAFSDKLQLKKKK